MHHGGVRVVLICIVSAVVLVRCATSYGPSGSRGGYHETWLSERELIVTFEGNSLVKSDGAYNYAALRACDLALQNGFSHLVVEESDSGGKTNTITLVGATTEVRPTLDGGATIEEKPPLEEKVFLPYTRLHVFLLKEGDVSAAVSNGKRPISARFYVEKNAPSDVRMKILGY